MNTDYNFLLDTDSYKVSHWDQYPKNTQNIYSYFEARRGAQYQKMIFFGLQYIIKNYLQGQVVTQDKIVEAQQILGPHFFEDVFNSNGWDYILKEHNGRLPLRIKAVEEGSFVNIDNVLMTVEVTDPKCYWLTNYTETMLSRIWYPCTVATRSCYIKKQLKKYYDLSNTDLGSLNFMLHDFGSRGATCHEAAGIGGMSHLVNFMGTDTVHAMKFAKDFYNADLDLVGKSIRATEHSVMTIRGEKDEDKVFEHLLSIYPSGMFACVSDSYDIDRFISEIVARYRKEILERNGKIVFRPDSGDPVEMVINVLNRLEVIFGSNININGFKSLNPKVGVIFGDGLSEETIDKILNALYTNKWTTDSCAYGLGGGLLQKVDRDTQRCAFKCSATRRDNQWIDVSKNPKTANKSDQFFKASKGGRLMLLKTTEGSYRTIKENSNFSKEADRLELVFENGELLRKQTFEQIREIATGALL